MHSCSSMGYLARSMSQATVDVILSRQQAGEAPGVRPAPPPEVGSPLTRQTETPCNPPRGLPHGRAAW